MDCLASSQISMTPENFMRLRNASAGGRGNPHVSNRYNFTGVYILFNQTRQMFYVGQAQRVLTGCTSILREKETGMCTPIISMGSSFSYR